MTAFSQPASCKAIRERAARQAKYLADESIPLTLREYEDRQAERDAAQLLRIIDRMECYLSHDAGCPPAKGAACDCGLDRLIAEMGEGR